MKSEASHSLAPDHWDRAYRDGGATGVSWFQAEPLVSMELIELLGVTPRTPVVDVGGGASLLVDRLVAAGYRDVSVLDVSAVALEEGRRRVGAGAPVTWLLEDLLWWEPTRRYGLWHDRAVFHFLTEPDDRDRYLRALRRALEPDGAVVVATFAEDGPDHCSGLPVARYSPDSLTEVLGPHFRLTACRRQDHVTPGGVHQPFTWVAGRLSPEPEPEIHILGLGGR